MFMFRIFPEQRHMEDYTKLCISENEKEKQTT